MMIRSVFNYIKTLAVAYVIVLGGQGTASANEIYTGVFGTWGNVKDEMFRVAKKNNFRIVVSTDIDKAASLNMQCLYPFWLSKDVAQDNVKWGKFLDNVKYVVNMNKNNSTVFGWYLADEPDWHDVPLVKLKELSQAIKAIDKNKPTFTVLTIPNKWKKYLPYFDIIAVDPYLDKTRLYAGRETDKIADWINKVRTDLSELKLSKPVYVVLGAFDRKAKGHKKSVFRKPTPAEFNKMIAISIQQNVEGILVFSLTIMEDADYYSWDLTKDDIPLWEAVKTLPSKVK